MKVLIFGSRSLTWKHLPMFRAVALHSLLDVYPYTDGSRAVPAMSKHLVAMLAHGGDDEWPRHRQSMVLLNGDMPPGAARGAIGADKMALLACMETWPEKGDDGKRHRHVRWFPPEPKRDAAGQALETEDQAAARADVEKVQEGPDRSYCIHTDLDSSRSSIITADALRGRGLPFWYLRVTASGELISVEQR